MRPDKQARASEALGRPGEAAADIVGGLIAGLGLPTRLRVERQGFRITKEVAGIPMAVVGEAGDGGPVIAILGEYDALPGLSQEAGVAEPRPLPGSGDGHGCGHNLLGSASLLAASAVKDFLSAHGIKGRV